MGSGEFSDGDSKADVIGTGASGSGTPKGKAAPLPRGNAVSWVSDAFEPSTRDPTDASRLSPVLDLQAPKAQM